MKLAALSGGYIRYTSVMLARIKARGKGFQHLRPLLEEAGDISNGTEIFDGVLKCKTHFKIGNYQLCTEEVRNRKSHFFTRIKGLNKPLLGSQRCPVIHKCNLNFNICRSPIESDSVCLRIFTFYRCHELVPEEPSAGASQGSRPLVTQSFSLRV